MSHTKRKIRNTQVPYQWVVPVGDLTGKEQLNCQTTQFYDLVSHFALLSNAKLPLLHHGVGSFGNSII